MTLERLREICLSLPGTEEKMPFAKLPAGESILCFYVGPRIFCITDIDNFEYANLKVRPDDGVELVERYQSIGPGRHMSKRHWISVWRGGDVDYALFRRLTIASYELVRDKLPRRLKEKI